VFIDTFEATDTAVRIDATVWVERKGQKAIVIGKQGRRLKLVASSARQDIERLLQRPVYLRTWVKTRENWADDLRALQSLGFTR
jgi:GTP-binding protein Era